MPLTLLFFEPDDGSAPLPLVDLAEGLAAEPGLVLGEPDADYQPFTWKHPTTGAKLEGDLGSAPLERDSLHSARAYPGWRPVECAMQIPLWAPHWHCVEALDLVQRLLERFPHLGVLDTEDTVRDAERGEEGPGPLNRLKILASWEAQHVAQNLGRIESWRMERRASLALWRYRRERPAGLADRPDLAWPEAMVLLDGERAVSAAFWPLEEGPFALPPVELVVIRRPQGVSGALPSDEVLTAAAGGSLLAQGGAVMIPATPAVAHLKDRARLLPAQRFRALADGDWSD